MATPHLVSDAPADGIPSGGQANITVSWDLAPGSADRLVTATVAFDGVPQGTLSGTFKGTAAEMKPTLVLNATTGWGISTSTGSLSAGVDSDHWVLQNV